MTSYSKRESILEATPRTWRIEPDALVQAGPGGEVRLDWRRVRQVRLRHAPTAIKSWRRVFSIDGPPGVSIGFDNGHYVSPGVFEDRSAAFSDFVAAVLDQLAEHAPAARLYLGATPLSYAALLAAMAIPLALLGWIVLAWPLAEPGPGNFTGRLLVIAAMLPVAGLWMVKARPRPATFQSLRDALPSAPGAKSG